MADWHGTNQPLYSRSGTPIFDILVVLFLFLVELLFGLFAVIGRLLGRENPWTEVFKFPFGAGVGESGSGGAVTIACTAAETQLVLALTQL